MFTINDFLTSGWKFDNSQHNLKHRYQMMNIGLLLSVIGLMYGIIGNYVRDIHGFIAIEAALLCINFIMFFALRRYAGFFEFFALAITIEYTFLFLFLIYFGEPNDLKHLWIFTYPIILLYFQKTIDAAYWLVFVLFMLIVAPIQEFVEVKYSLYQVTYISFILIIISIIIYFYQRKIDEASNIVLEQQDMLLHFNTELEKQVKDKTIELIELNESLELKVEQKLEELRNKDQILEAQSKQAVMGEMISMIAHQWRQPLSTITLHIANLQFKKLLGKDLCNEDTDSALSEISDTIMYLSETVDDFLTYFHPDKEIVEIEIHDLIQKAVTFVLPRVKEKGIEIVTENCDNVRVQIYVNEFVQVLLNILNNAIDALNDSGGNRSKVYISSEITEDDFTVFITDNAGGIKEENISRLFEPYFSTKGKNGTGLGLYMSQMIIQKQFCGNIDVKSNKYGSTFSVKVPRNIV